MMSTVEEWRRRFLIRDFARKGHFLAHRQPASSGRGRELPSLRNQPLRRKLAHKLVHFYAAGRAGARHESTPPAAMPLLRGDAMSYCVYSPLCTHRDRRFTPSTKATILRQSPAMQRYQFFHYFSMPSTSSSAATSAFFQALRPPVSGRRRLLRLP